MRTSELILSSNARFKSTTVKESLLDRFTTWCASQEKNKMAWTGTALGVHGCVLTPITLFVVIFAGIQTWMLALTAASIMLTLVAILSALPLKHAIPIFATSFLINIVLITTAIIGGVDIAKFI
jgi:hypothetical protein